MKRDKNDSVLPETGDAIFGSRRLSSILNPASLSFALVGLLITTFAASTLYQAQKDALGTRFNSDTDNIHRLLKARLDNGVRLMQTSGAFLTTSGGVNEKQWHEFLMTMDPKTNLSGLQGIGYATIAPPSVHAFPEGAREKEEPDSSSTYAPILFFESLSGVRSDGIPGRDLASNLPGLEAVATARDTGQCAIAVDPGWGGVGKSAFLFCLPHYEDGVDISTVALRRKAIRGFVFAPIEVAGLIEDMFTGSEQQIGLRIVDGGAPPGNPPVFTSTARNVKPTFRSASEIHAGGRFWRVETFSLATFENRKMRLSSLFIALSGIAITLLGMMILSDSMAKQERATRIAQSTAESLKQSEDEIREMNAGLEKAVATRTARLEEANEELRSFSYTVSHDLRAPARHVEALAGFLVKEHGGELSPGAIDYLAKISDSALRMQSLIEDILHLANCSNTAIHPRRVDLTALATELAETFRCLHQSRAIHVEIEPGLELFGDEAVVRTTMQNLLDNAFKFTARREIALVSIGAVVKDGKQFHYVRDNGTGFDSSQAEKIFQPFKRLHRQSEFEGSGVGLATVRKMIRRHGGEIHVDSEPGTGSTFYFHLNAEEWTSTADSLVAEVHHDTPAVSNRGAFPCPPNQRAAAAALEPG